MAEPIVYFGYSRIGLTVNFVNTTLNNPDSYIWDFGDGNNSTEKNPSHTYLEMGSFTVKLTATNLDGEKESVIIVDVTESEEPNSIDISIMDLINPYILTTPVSDIITQNKSFLIKKWQLYLQPLVFTPIEVSEEDTHNEVKWPILVNMLIAQLVAYDIIVQAASKFMFNSIDPGYEDGTTVLNKQAIKSIETGPAKTEWYEDSSIENIKNIAEAMANLSKPGGAIDMLKSSICALSKRVSIYLPMCGAIDINMSPRVFNSCKEGKHNANPFGVTRRMR